MNYTTEYSLKKIIKDLNFVKLLMSLCINEIVLRVFKDVRVYHFITENTTTQ